MDEGTLAERSLERIMKAEELYYFMPKIKMLLYCCNIMEKVDSRITKNTQHEASNHSPPYQILLDSLMEQKLRQNTFSQWLSALSLAIPDLPHNVQPVIVIPEKKKNLLRK